MMENAVYEPPTIKKIIRYVHSILLLLFIFIVVQKVHGFTHHDSTISKRLAVTKISLLSNKYLENDLVSVKPPIKFASILNSKIKEANHSGQDVNTFDDDISPILCVVRSDGTIDPLCVHEDDNENDLYVHPKLTCLWTNEEINDDDIIDIYGEGWYGQRVVPSLGGGPGYGASADDVWTVDMEILNRIKSDNVIIPVLDLGIAHGEKARGGAI